MKVVVGASSFAENDDKAIKLLQQKSIDVLLNAYGRKMSEEEIIACLQGADGLLAGLEPLNDNVFTYASELKAIARIGIGMDNVDLKAAKNRGIKVSNTPEGPTEAVAEMTVAACLSVIHQIIPANQDMHNGIWRKRMGISIAGSRVFIIGYGRIGKKTAELFKVLGAEVVVYDKFQQNSSSVSLEEGLKTSDIVSLHVSGNEEILRKNELMNMKEGAVILNSARGGLVNEEALYDWLKSGRAGGYWGDAHWQEPYYGKIAECGNAVLTPHISTYTKRCRERMEMQAVENLLRDLAAL